MGSVAPVMFAALWLDTDVNGQRDRGDVACQERGTSTKAARDVSPCPTQAVMRKTLGLPCALHDYVLVHAFSGYSFVVLSAASQWKTGTCSAVLTVSARKGCSLSTTVEVGL